MLNVCLLGFFERELKKSDIEAHEPVGIEESPAPRDIVDLEVRFETDVNISAGLCVNFKQFFYCNQKVIGDEYYFLRMFTRLVFLHKFNSDI